MAGETEAFLAELEAREHDPLLEHMKGTLLIELLDGERADHVMVQFSGGRAVVDRSTDASQRDITPDCVVRAPRALFVGFVTGRVNAMAAFLRCEVEIEGDPGLLMRFGRLFPGPPEATAAPSAGARQTVRSRA